MEDKLSYVRANSDYVQEYWLPTNIAIQEVVSFERRFGEKHLLLACHMALPFLFTLEMLNLININFLEHESLSWFAEADFLLSPLCHQIDDTLFEVEPRVREILLVKLEKRFGYSRLLDIANFLLAYIAKSQELQRHAATVTTLRWIALSYLAPNQAIIEISAQFRESLVPDTQQASQVLGQLLVTTTLTMITESLEQTTLQQEYYALLYDTYFLAKLLYTDEETTVDKELDKLSKYNQNSLPSIEHLMKLFSPAMQDWLLQQRNKSSSRQNTSIDEQQIATIPTQRLADHERELQSDTSEVLLKQDTLFDEQQIATIPTQRLAELEQQDIPLTSNQTIQSNETIDDVPVSPTDSDISPLPLEQELIIDGDLQTLSLQAVLKMLTLSQKTGTLRVSSTPETLSISLRAGKIVDLPEASMSQYDVLGMLCLIGRLDLERAQTIRELAQGDMRVALNMLVERGWMRGAEVQRRLEFAAMQSISHAMRWVNGHFAFYRQLAPIESIIQPLNVDTILQEAQRQADEWEEVVNNGTTQLTHTTVVRWQSEINKDVRSLGLSQESIEVLCLSNGEVPLQAMALVLMLPEVRIAYVIMNLLELNLIEVVDTALEADLQHDLSNIIIRCQYMLAQQRSATNADQRLLGLIVTLAECINGLLAHHGRYARSLRGRGQVSPMDVVRYLERRFVQPLQLLAQEQYPILDTTAFSQGQLDCDPILGLNKIMRGDQLGDLYWEAVQGLVAFSRLVFAELLRDEVGNSHTGRQLSVAWKILLSEIEHEVQQYQVYRAHRNTQTIQRDRDRQESLPATTQNEKNFLERADISSKGSETIVSERNGYTVLVVDDSPTIRKIVQTILQRENIRVITAEDGLSALTLISRELPDLVLLDMMLPRLDGYAVCRTVRKNLQFRHIPIIALSGKDGLFDKGRARLAGITEYVTKPFVVDELLALVTHYVAKKPERHTPL